MASSIAVMLNWTLVFIVTKSFGMMNVTFGSDVTFWIFAVCMAIATTFTALKVPETKGKNACTIGVTVHSKTEILDEDGTIQQVKYYINDGIFGCFCDVAYGRDVGIPKILSQRQTSTEDSEIPENLLKCSIWGQSCDGIDKICNNLLLPNINLGDVLLFPNMGAYSIVLACNFNGFPIANVLHYADHETLKILNG
uniref:Orn/DAP/Arg decarboxylase 2 C-terminal domain-containing protein n=2 Tax=Lutzomyia longipalpis TaxID=7200 RepID=A0A1B0FV16_LUTLO